MKTITSIMPMNRLVLLAAALTVVLAGCTKSGSNGTPSGSGLPASTAPVTSVPAPTYPAGDARLAIFNQLNSYRAALGVGELTQNTQLDAAASEHANYLNVNNTESHSEMIGNPGFFGTTPRVRATEESVDSSAWVGEVIGAAGTCASQLIDTVYHLEVITGSVEQVGIGIGGSWVCVLDGATITGTAGTTPPDNAIPTWGGQQIASTAVVVSPYNGETGVDTAMSLGENPRPVPQYSNPGRPVMVRVRADGSNDMLTVSGFSVSDSSGSPLPGTILVASNAGTGSTAAGVTVDGYILNGVAFFVPASPLASATTYTAVFSGARNGTAVAQTWSFTTQ